MNLNKHSALTKVLVSFLKLTLIPHKGHNVINNFRQSSFRQSESGLIPKFTSLDQLKSVVQQRNWKDVRF